MKNQAASMGLASSWLPFALAGPQNDFDGFQWMADFYAFGGVLSRINQATDRPQLLRLLAPLPLKWQGHIMRWRDTDLDAAKERSPSLSVLDAA
jgi:hypothetical protein